VFFTVIFIFAAAQNIHAQSARECYEQGLALREAGDIDGAIEMFDKARKKDRGFAEANYELALCYMTKDSPTARMHAKYALDRALELDPDNIDYRNALSFLYFQQDFIYNARKSYEDVVEREPDNIEAMERLAEIHRYAYDEVRYGIRITSDLGSDFMGLGSSLLPNIRLRQLALEDFEKAMNWNDRILAIDNNNREALYSKGQMYYEEGAVDSMVTIFQNILDRNDRDKDAHLFVGLGYARKRDYDTAFERFQSAFEFMPPEERAVMESIDYIHSDFDLEEWKNSHTLQDTDTTTFWLPKDPLYITPYNERKLEHYCRIAEANLKFSKPRQNLEGWTTDQGRIWIRYGAPRMIMDRLQDTLLLPGHPPITHAPVYYKYRYWDYVIFRLEFTTAFKQLSDIFELRVPWEWRYKPTEEDIRTKIPELFTYKPRGRLIDVPVDMLRFRGELGRTELHFYYGPWVKDVRLSEKDNVLTGSLYNGFFLFDNEWNRLVSQLDTVSVAVDEKIVQSTPHLFLALDRRVSLPAGKYNVAVELVDPASGNTGIYHDSLKVSYFTYDSLRMSDILVATRVTAIDPQKNPSVNNISVAGNPFHSFGQKQPVYLYFEIYNLVPAASNDRSNYRIEYALYPAEERGLLDRIFRRRRGDEGVSVTSNITGTGRRDNRILVVEHGIEQPGEYLLTVRITDRNSGQSTERTTSIWIY
ncbi:GWxTD domain-containing protein, partial [candidate division KSB1 bacterium]